LQSLQITPEDQLVREIILQVSEQEIYQSVFDLQNFGTRVYGYLGNTAASTYIYNRFTSIPELNVEYQGGDLRNVIATLPGLDASSNEIYLVGAHYDSTSSDPNNAPGATDDASGVAIVLEFARIMSQYRFKHTIKFACWNGEENGGFGSQNYAAYASDNDLNIPLYVNLDSSSYDPYDGFILDIMYDSQSEWAASMLTEHNTLYGINFTLTYNAHTCGSDHLSFRQYGYASVMTHEETHGPAHTPNDTVDKVSTLYAKKNGQLCMSILVIVAQPISETSTKTK
jgi:Zn-dependent M28 family amino/carboxypeptidase